MFFGRLLRCSKHALGLMLLGALLLVIALSWQKHFTWNPVNFSVGPHPGLYRSPPVVVGPTGHYNVGLEVDRTIPYETLNCLVGWSDIRRSPQCRGITTDLDMTWTAYSDGQLVAKGSSGDTASSPIGEMHLGGWISEDQMYRVIGKFIGISGHTYTVEINLLSDIQALAQTAPRIAIRTPSLEHEGTIFASALLSIFAMLITLIGIIWARSSFVTTRVPRDA